MKTHIQSLAEWAVSLRAADIPARIMDAAHVQIMSVLASLYPGAASQAGRLCKNAALRLRTTGDATVVPSGEKVSPYAAVLANAALSMAYDFDDYLFLGHTGHSSVLAALAAAEDVDASMGDFLAAQVVANEVSGRLGAYVAIGPQNGQLWAHIHLAGAAVAAARLYGLTGEQAADALSIAFYQPPFTLFAGFMGSEAKALTAAQPAALGLYAAGLAADGMKGSHSILEHPRGFAQHFSFIAMPDVLGGLGNSWVTDTLSCKIYPGCAYIDGPVDAALKASGATGLCAKDIVHVEIVGTALTAGMESISEEAVPADSLDPIAINFSARRSVAIALLAGALTPDLLDGPWLKTNADAVRRVARVTQVRASVQKTMTMLEGIGNAVPLGSLARSIGARRAWRARRQIGAAYTAATRGRGHHPPPSAAPASSTPLGALAAFLRNARGASAPLDMNVVDFSRLEFRFGADVEITLRDGRKLHGHQAVPQGAAGHGLTLTRALMVDKLKRQTEAVGQGPCADAILKVLDQPEEQATARELTRAATAQVPAAR